MDPAVAAAAPTAGMTGLSIIDVLAPLASKTVLLVGAAGGVGSFASQFAVDAGAHVIATGRADNTERLRSYGVENIVDHAATSLPQAVARMHPDGVDVLVDLASDAEAFATLAALVRDGGTALSTRYVADAEDLTAKGVSGVDFRLPASTELLERVADALAAGSIAPPPMHRISLTQAPDAFADHNGPADGKTVIVL